MTVLRMQWLLFLVGVLSVLGCTPKLKRDLQEKFPNPVDCDLVYAAWQGDKQKIAQLLHAGADLECRGWRENTPLNFAVFARNKKATLTLLEMGADPNSQDDSGHSPISEAAGVDHDTWFLETVMAHGGNVNLVNKYSRETPLFKATHSLENVRILVKAGADIHARNQFEETPLIRAAMNDSYEVVYYLLELGADPRTKMDNGMTILYPIQSFYAGGATPETAAWREKVIAWLKERNLWHIEEPVWQPGYKKKTDPTSGR